MSKDNRVIAKKGNRQPRFWWAYITDAFFQKSVHPRVPRCGLEDPNDHRHLVFGTRHQRVLSTSSRPVFSFFCCFSSTTAHSSSTRDPRTTGPPLVLSKFPPLFHAWLVGLFGLFGNIFKRDRIIQVQMDCRRKGPDKYFSNVRILNLFSTLNYQSWQIDTNDSWRNFIKKIFINLSLYIN